MDKYVVRHPNFDTYLKLLPEPISIFYSDDDMTEIEKVKTHDWVEDKTEATQFNSEWEARENYTSPLCKTLPAQGAETGYENP